MVKRIRFRGNWLLYSNLIVKVPLHHPTQASMTTFPQKDLKGAAAYRAPLGDYTVS